MMTTRRPGRAASGGTALRRARTVRIYDVGDRMVVLGRGGDGHELAGDSAELARVVLAFFEQPHSIAELMRQLESLSGGPVEHANVVHDLVQLLLDVDAIERVHAGVATGARMQRHAPSRVVLGLTGAVASMHAPAMVTALQVHGFVVRIVATESALRFVQPAALEALTHERVIASLWPTEERLPVPHINLATWADAVVICPASATTISRLATGDHDSVVAATALATRAPVLVVPSMNPEMYASPAVQRNLAQLAADGMHVAHPSRGLELAEAPTARVPLLGAAPPPAIVVQLLQAIMRGAAKRPRVGEDWDALYGARGDDELPWQVPAMDHDIAEALARAAAPPSSVLDVGTGLGTLAVECAGRGHRVVAIDLSAVALERARALAPEAPVVWLEDDIVASKLRGVFEIVLDRGCLHLLDTEQAAGYAASVARLTAPGGVLVVKTLAAGEAERRGATAFGRTEIEALFGHAFALEHDSSSTLPGPSESPAAQLFVLRRH